MENSPGSSNVKQIEKLNYVEIPTKILSTDPQTPGLSAALVPYLSSVIVGDAGHAHSGVLSHL